MVLNCANALAKSCMDFDVDILEKLASVSSMQGYIKELIRADLKK